MANTLNTKANIKAAIVIVVTLIFLVGAGLIITLLFAATPQYSQEPTDWIISQNGTQAIDITQMSEGTSVYNGRYQQIPLQNNEVAGLYTYGIYQGTVFERVLYGENNTELMRVTPILIRPNDGIPQAFGLAKLINPYDELVGENGVPVPRIEAIYVYVDEDFKQLFAQGISIIWGADISNPTTLTRRAFNFSHAQDGLYYDSIATDIDWVLQTRGERKGRVFVGPLSVQDIVDEHLNTTFIALI